MAATGPSPFQNTLTELIRARHPVLLVQTQEADRVIAAVSELLTHGMVPRGRGLQLYSLTRGLHAPGGGAGRRVAPEQALADAANITEPTVFIFQDLHHQLGAGGSRAEPVLIRAILDTAMQFKNGPIPHTLIIVSPTLALPPDLEKAVTVVDLPLPTEEEIGAVLESIVSVNRDAITDNLSEDDRRRLIQAAQGLTLWEADNAFARALVADRMLDAGDITMVLEEKRQTIRKAGLLEFIPPAGSLDDVGGLGNLKTWLTQRGHAWSADAAKWGIPAPKGLLITGVPGCGKSLTATCVSAQWGLPLLRLDVGRVFAGLVGSSEENMRRALSLAEAVAPAVLWIDEIEKGFGTGQGGDAGTSRRVLGTFLTWMQEKDSPVFVIATANAIDALPPEFLRKGRFDEIFFVDLPTRAEREDIWRLHLTQRLTKGPSAAGGIEIESAAVQLAEATEGFSGAEIAQAAVAGCFDAFEARRPLTMEDLLTAVRNTVPLSVTQAEQIAATRQWAQTRAVAATAKAAREEYAEVTPEGKAPEGDIGSWRGGRTIDF